MKREIVYLSVGLVGLAVYGWAVQSGGGTAMSLPYVSLQSGTPGNAQTGHINVTGTIIGGQHVGGGAGLTGVNADLLDGLNSTAFGQLASGNTWTGVNTFGNAANSFTGNGAGLTNLNATNISAGTLNAARLPVPLTMTGASNTHMIGVTNTSTTHGASGVYGLANGSSGNTYGVYGRTLSTQGFGVYGIAFNSGANSGVFGESVSPSGYGVWGWASSSSGNTYGVFGRATSYFAGAYAVYAAGNLGASGTKSFRIDHPFDPENKYLLHYASESPMPQNFYVGNVVTDARGYAWVELPDYFAEINANFKYQLTVVDGPNSDADDFVQVKVRQKIIGNRFQIRTSAPNIEVSWRVDADRNDLYVRNRKPKDVIEKEGPERGKYQHPELYGEPEERGMNYRPKEKTIQQPHQR